MAMSDTGSSLANWSDDLYHYDIPSPGMSLGAMDGGGAVDSTIVAASTGAAAATPTSPASAGSADGSPNRASGGVLGPRAAGKPASAGRKRARASRRAPVTMLNTDAANFRAMVQQFTGIPTPPAGPVINFGVPNYGFHHQQPPPAQASASFDHLHQQQQHQQYATGATFGYGNGDVFAHGFGSAQDRMLLQSMQAAQTMMPAANNTANGFFS